MNGYYSIEARVERVIDGWTHTEHTPTFYLHSVVQGIVNEAHASRIAQDMIRRLLPKGDNAIIYASAVFIGGES